MPDENFLGRGAAFPFSVNAATGRIETSEGKQSVKESLFLILKTTVGERLLRSDFGTTLNNYAFMAINPTNMQLLRREIINQIARCEPRIDDIELTADNSQEGVLLFNLRYTVREDNVPENLVFPFYLDKAVDIGEQQEMKEEVNLSDVLESVGDYVNDEEIDQ
ncbi:MAG: GPW/gp25 family protein [Lachnospiraceae bacterium]|nr:GPW/gp25 family protein [Lachnospiraceae bacterium]